MQYRVTLFPLMPNPMMGPMGMPLDGAPLPPPEIPTFIVEADWEETEDAVEGSPLRFTRLYKHGEATGAGAIRPIILMLQVPSHALHSILAIVPVAKEATA